MTSPRYKRIVHKAPLPYTYIQTRLEFEDDYACPEIGVVAFKTIIVGAMRCLYGEVGACIAVDVLKYNPNTKDAILRVPASNTAQVWSSLTLHGRHAGLVCAFRISQVSSHLIALAVNSRQ